MNNQTSFNISDMQKCQSEYEKYLKESPFRSEIDKIRKDIIEQKNNAMAMEFTRVICDLLRENKVYVHCTEHKLSEDITENSIKEKYGIIFDGMDFSEHDKVFTNEIKDLKDQLQRKETAINQIDDILNELFGVTHDVTSKPDEFKEILKKKIESTKTIADFLPTEPIKVADILINAEGEATCSSNVEEMPKFFKVPYHLFNKSKLRQIAGHLLIYCNANRGEKE